MSGTRKKEKRTSEPPNGSRRAMEGDWVTVDGDRICLVMTAKEALAAETELYRYYDTDGVLLYVGISVNSLLRLIQHRSAPWFKKIARIEIEHFPTRTAAEAAEYHTIKNQRPSFNVIWKSLTC